MQLALGNELSCTRTFWKACKERPSHLRPNDGLPLDIIGSPILGIVEEEIPEGDILPAFYGDDLAFLENGGEFFFCVEVNMIKLPAFAKRRRK